MRSVGGMPDSPSERNSATAVAVVVEVAMAAGPSTPTSVAEWRKAATRRFGTPERRRVKREAGARRRPTTALPQRVAGTVLRLACFRRPAAKARARVRCRR